MEKSRLRDQIEYILLNDKKYFENAERFIELHEQFSPDNLISKVMLTLKEVDH